jgi:hypothetical protein
MDPLSQVLTTLKSLLSPVILKSNRLKIGEEVKPSVANFKDVKFITSMLMDELRPSE